MSSKSITGTETPNKEIDIVRHYFEIAPLHDTDGYLALFAADAIAEDEGHVHHGIEQIRAWRSEVPSVSYDVGDISRIGDDLQAVVSISGDFPGSPVTLRFLFQISAAGLITRLAIRT